MVEKNGSKSTKSTHETTKTAPVTSKSNTYESNGYDFYTTEMKAPSSEIYLKEHDTKETPKKNSNNSIDEFGRKLVSSTGWKIIATIMALVWILNLIPTWYGTETLPGVKNKDDMGSRILWWVLGVIFWIPGIIISIKWIWFN